MQVHRLANGAHGRGHQPVVVDHAHDAAQVRAFGPPQQPTHQQQRKRLRGEDQADHQAQFFCGHLPAASRQQHVAQDQRDHHDADERLPVFAVLALRQALLYPIQ
jgi:Vesicle coat complex COPII, subunit SEC24/subunit SFB2/subunit SFB3